jgi:SNF2 family DNA or RNA helicase
MGMATIDYIDFLNKKAQLGTYDGFDPLFMPEFLFDFQKSLLEWAVKKGRSAIFADCGLGKTPIQLAWAQNIVQKTNQNVLIITPLAVSHQTIKEGEKFQIECSRSENGKSVGKITITNYERLHLFNPHDFIGVVCDESSILKNFNGKRRKIITEFLKKKPYRLLCTATASPNDYIELGTSSEALGELGFMDMLNRFFKNDQNTSDTRRHWALTGGGAPKWRFKKHAEIPFWKWVCSWARAMRKPSDLGFDDRQFILPKLIEAQTIIENQQALPGELFVRPAIGLREQREELRITLHERCEKAAELVRNNGIALVWCYLNAEGDLLEQLIPDAVQVSGSDSDNKKEEALNAFSNGEIRVLITKPKIAGFGLNWQHCSHMTFFPSHSFEQYYQAVRRCWRFGQINPVKVDIITTKGGEGVLKNLQKKAQKADEMFSQLITYMDESLKVNISQFEKQMEVPGWL